jgi:hypothetical protein
MDTKQQNYTLALPARRKSRSAQKIKLNTRGLPKDFFVIPAPRQKKSKTLLSVPASLDYLNQTCYFREDKPTSLPIPRKPRNYKSEPR